MRRRPAAPEHDALPRSHRASHLHHPHTTCRHTQQLPCHPACQACSAPLHCRAGLGNGSETRRESIPARKGGSAARAGTSAVQTRRGGEGGTGRARGRTRGAQRAAAAVGSPASWPPGRQPGCPGQWSIGRSRAAASKDRRAAAAVQVERRRAWRPLAGRPRGGWSGAGRRRSRLVGADDHLGAVVQEHVVGDLQLMQAEGALGWQGGN